MTPTFTCTPTCTFSCTCTYTYTCTCTKTFTFSCACASVCLCVCLLCGAVSCRVSRVVARYFLFVVRHMSLVVDVLRCVVLCCSVLLRAVAVAVAGFCWLLECLRMQYPSPFCCLTCWLLAGSSVFFSLFLLVFVGSTISRASACSTAVRAASRGLALCP